MKGLSQKLKQLMGHKRLTVKQLSDITLISLPYLYEILRGKANPESISLGKLLRIAQALDVSLSELMEEPGYLAIQKFREQLLDQEIQLVDMILNLKADDWRRKAILHMLGLRQDDHDAEQNLG